MKYWFHVSIESVFKIVMTLTLHRLSLGQFKFAANFTEIGGRANSTENASIQTPKIPQHKFNVQPCTKFKNFDMELLKSNMYELFHNPGQFYSSQMLLECNLAFVDPRNIRVPRDKKYVWISFMGDSLMRTLWASAVERFSGGAYDTNWLLRVSSERTRAGPKHVSMMLLGNHLGPWGDEAYGDIQLTYHQSKVLCCKTSEKYHTNNDSNRCIYAIEHVISFIRTNRILTSNHSINMHS